MHPYDWEDQISIMRFGQLLFLNSVHLIGYCKDKKRRFIHKLPWAEENVGYQINQQNIWYDILERCLFLHVPIHMIKSETLLKIPSLLKYTKLAVLEQDFYEKFLKWGHMAATF